VRKLLSILLVASACSGGSGPEPKSSGDQTAQPAAPGQPAKAAATAGEGYAALEVGADYAGFTKVSTEPFVSPTHGKRYVEIWVNDVGLAAYQGEDEFPVGSIIVKESWENDGKGGKTDVRGPLFVMEKRAKGFNDDHSDWWYALHWEKVPENWAAKMGANQVYWRSPSKKIQYCHNCHESFDREVGLPAKGYRTWEKTE
jgi:hypothetical protein